MKTLTEIAKDCGAIVHADGNIFLTNETKLQAIIDAVNARDSEPVATLHINDYGEYRLEPADNFKIGKFYRNVDINLFTSPQPNQSVGGYALVPIEPTEAMLKAGCEAGLDIHALMDDELFSTDKAVYKAMIKSYTNK